MNCLIAMLFVMAQAAHCTLILAGSEIDSFYPSSGRIAKAGYYFLIFLMSTGAGFFLLFLPLLGLVKWGVFKRPCPRAVAMVLFAWIVFVGTGWVWRATVDHGIDLTLDENRRIVDIVRANRTDLGQVDDSVFLLIGDVWRVTSIEIQNGQQYCVEVESYLWLRIPEGRSVYCFDILRDT